MYTVLHTCSILGLSFIKAQICRLAAVLAVNRCCIRGESELHAGDKALGLYNLEQKTNTGVPVVLQKGLVSLSKIEIYLYNLRSALNLWKIFHNFSRAVVNS